MYYYNNNQKKNNTRTNIFYISEHWHWKIIIFLFINPHQNQAEHINSRENLIFFQSVKRF